MAQRWAWIGFAALIAMALLGLTGAGGPLSWTVVTAPGGRLDVPKVVRRATPQRMTLILDGTGPERRIHFSDAFSEAIEITEVQPPPESVVAVPGGESWQFRAGSELPMRVRIRAQTQSVAHVSFQVGFDGGEPLGVSIVVLP